MAGRRERFLKSNFESLSGAEDNNGDAPSKHNKSISNQFREGTNSAVSRNAKTIARAASFRDEEQNRKRLELQRRIEETRKKLQNVRINELINPLFKHYCKPIEAHVIKLFQEFGDFLMSLRSVEPLSVGFLFCVLDFKLLIAFNYLDVISLSTRISYSYDNSCYFVI